MACNELSAGHELLLQAFLRFSTAKRQAHEREILQCIDEAKGTVSSGEMYSSADLQQLLDGLREEMARFVKKEVEQAYHTSGLLVRLQLEQAQQAGVSISVDTSLLESEMLLNQIQACEAEALRRPAADFITRKGTLAGLPGGLVRTVPDPAAGMQRDQLRGEVDALTARLEALQTAATAARAETAETARQLRLAQEQAAAKEAEGAKARSVIAELQKAAAISALGSAAAASDAGRAAAADAGAAAKAAEASAAAATQQLLLVRKQLEEATNEVKALHAVLDCKLQDSRQWQQFRQLMQEKSREVVGLRQQLAKYEPQNFLSE